VTEGLRPLETERVPLDGARGRVLAEDLAAQLTQPPFDASAMDGFAVRAADLSKLPAALTVIGEAVAGAGFAGTVGSGQAVRIFTGAPVPKGADVVVIQENVDLDGDEVTVRAAEAARHIRPRGQDFKAGEVLLRAGTKLGPRELLLAAAMNYAELPVRWRPKVAILSTGDEVVPPGA
jgi:molybdopterin molybdotransferase